MSEQYFENLEMEMCYTFENVLKEITLSLRCNLFYTFVRYMYFSPLIYVFKIICAHNSRAFSGDTLPHC